MYVKQIVSLTLVLFITLGCSESDSTAGANEPANAIDVGSSETDANSDTPDGGLMPDSMSGTDLGILADANDALDASETLDSSPPDDASAALDSSPPGDMGVAIDCESACETLVACLISDCRGFNQGAEAQLSARCLDRCTPQQAEEFASQTCQENIAQLSEDGGPIADACRDSDGTGEGFNMLYIGHSFGRTFAERLPNMASNVGVGNHRSQIVFSGGASGAPLALWENAEKRREAQGILDEGDIELMVMICCSLPWIEDGEVEDPGIINWMNYALEQNPNTRFGLAMPWIDFPESYATAAEYSDRWELGYTQWKSTVDALRLRYPDVEIFAIPHGRASGDLMTLFEMDALPDVNQLRGPSNSSIYTDPKGHAGQILRDMGGLIWLGSIYGVDVSNYPFERNYVTDIAGLAQSIVAEDDYTRQP